MFCVVLFILAFSALQASALPKLDGRIVGGKEVEIEEFPHQISLQYVWGHKCGGSIIGKRFVVTAAHCTNGVTQKFLHIRYGSSIHDDGGRTINVTKVHQHPEFDEITYDHDVSVLELEEDIELGVRASIIAMEEGDVGAGTMAQVSGWGYTSEGGSYSDHLKAVSVPVVDRNVCGDAYAPAGITERMLCAGYLGVGGQDACQGDSGGPLIVNKKLIGIVSWGEGCASPTHPGVYANIAELRSFIREISGI